MTFEQWAIEREKKQMACIMELRHICIPLETDYLCLACYDSDIPLLQEVKNGESKD